MIAVVLAGGKGTRLREVTGDDLPKPMAEICGKPILSYVIDNLKESGINVCNLDRPLIETTADCLSRIYIARKAIDEQGMVFEHDGKRTTNPYVKIHLDYMTKLTQLTSRLGLDPSSRSTLASLHVENKEEEQDEVMQLIKSLKE